MGAQASPSAGEPMRAEVPDPLPLEVITMGHEGQRQHQGQAFASFTGRDSSGARHSYRMPYGSWVSADRPTIVTVTVREGIQHGG